LVCFPAACDIFNTHASSSFIKTTHKNTHVFFDDESVVVFESDVDDENDDERLLLFVSFEHTRRRENDDEEKAQEFRHFLYKSTKNNDTIQRRF